MIVRTMATTPSVSAFKRSGLIPVLLFRVLIPERDDGSKTCGKWLNPFVNRKRIAGFALAAAAACCSASALAKDAPKPSLTLDPITARTLLAPVEDVRNLAPVYRLDPGPEPAAGQRARLSVELGDSTLFAITGRLSRQLGPPGPLKAGHARALGLKRGDSGKVYGAGISRTIRGVDVSATYQYSKLSREQPEGSEAGIDGLGRSHSLRATARIRFRP
jgi:hypothetical protein